MSETLDLYFNNLQHSVQLTGCSHLLEFLPIVFPGQEFHQGQADQSPLITIQFHDGVYHFSTAWSEETKHYPDMVDALCDLVAKLTYARSFYDRQSLYLHAAGVVMNGRLLIFPSQYRAGKSFLTTALVAAGHRYLSDDVVPIDLATGKGHAPDIALRLRLPLPDSTDEPTRDFIEQHMAIAGKRYAYLNLDEGMKVGHDEMVDIGAFVLLERVEGAPAQLEELPVATVFQQLIKQNFAREIDANLILATLTQALSRAQCYKLQYDRADAAVNLLAEHFQHWPSQPEALQGEAIKAGAENSTAENITAGALIRDPQAQKIGIEGESFLTSPDGKAIYHLNVIGSGIWELLAEPTTKDEIVSILAEAFPQIESAIIENDVTEILNRLQASNLIHH